MSKSLFQFPSRCHGKIGEPHNCSLVTTSPNFSLSLIKKLFLSFVSLSLSFFLPYHPVSLIPRSFSPLSLFQPLFTIPSSLLLPPLSSNLSPSLSHPAEVGRSDGGI